MPYCSKCKQLVDSWRHNCVPNKPVPNNVPNNEPVRSVARKTRAVGDEAAEVGGRGAAETRSAAWKRANRESYNAYQREYMRKRRAERN